MSGRRFLADYAAVGVAPVLIFLMISSLANFFVMLFYQGDFTDRIFYLILMYTMGSVALARLVIEEDRNYAAGYAIALGAAMMFVMAKFVGSILFCFGIVLLIGYLADRIVHDCTIINDDTDASGEGLIDRGLDEARGLHRQMTYEGDEDAESDRHKRRRKSHQPGRTVFLLALAALPLFGLGQFMLQNNPKIWARAQLMLGLYLFSSLSLLVATSFLNLRRYLRQRDTDMPQDVTIAWLAGGIGLIFALLLLAFLAPLPGQAIASISVPKFLRSSPKTASQAGWGNEGAEKSESESNGKTNRDENPSQKKQQGAGENQNNPSGKTGGSKPSSKSGGSEPGESQSKGSDPKQSGEKQSGEKQSGEKQSGEKQSGEKQSGEKQSGEKQSGEKQSGEKQSGEKQSGEKQSGEKQSGEKQSGEKQSGEKQSGEKQSGEKQSGEKQSGEKQSGEKQSGEKQSGEKQSGEKQSGEKQSGEKQSGEKQSGEKQSGEKQSGEKQSGEKQSGEKQSGEKPPSDKSDQNKSKPPQDEGSDTSDSAQKDNRQDNAKDEQTDQQDSEQDQSRESAESEDQRSSNEPSDQPPQESGQSSMPSMPDILPSIAGVLRFLIVAALAAVLGYYLYLMRDRIAQWWQSLFDRPATEAGLTMTEKGNLALAPPPRPFASFRNPIGSEPDPRKIVIITFQAFDAWTRERGLSRNQDETPSEFVERLRRRIRTDSEVAIAIQPVETPTRILSAAYDRIVYGRGGAKQRDLDAAKLIWQHMQGSRVAAVH